MNSASERIRLIENTPRSRPAWDNRSQIREELPLSTRVHELAKELGLKSQELLERIQKWGLDVKANALASLDPPMVDRIRELMDQPVPERTVEAPTRRTASGVRRRPSPMRGRATRHPAVRRRRQAPAPAGVRRARPRRAAALAARPPAGSAATAAAPQRLVPGSSPSGPRPTARRPSAPAHQAAGSNGRPGSSRPQPAPLARPAVFSGTRPAGGPLSAHTPHRGAGPRPGGPTSAGARPALRSQARPTRPGFGRRGTASASSR